MTRQRCARADSSVGAEAPKVDCQTRPQTGGRSGRHDGVTDPVIAALATALLPFREQLEAAWAGKAPAPQRSQAVADLLTIPAVAERLSCSRTHVYDLLAAGELVRRNIGAGGQSKARVTAASVAAYVARDLRRGIDPTKSPS